MINAVFFEISKENNFVNDESKIVGSFFLKYKNAKPNVMIPDAITPADHTPVSKGSGVTGSIPGIFTVSETRIKEGKITDTKEIKTIPIEKRNTIQGIILFLEYWASSDSVLSEDSLLLSDLFFTLFSHDQKYF